jgi:hypothetical protein
VRTPHPFPLPPSSSRVCLELNCFDLRLALLCWGRTLLRAWRAMVAAAEARAVRNGSRRIRWFCARLAGRRVSPLLVIFFNRLKKLTWLCYYAWNPYFASIAVNRLESPLVVLVAWCAILLYVSSCGNWVGCLLEMGTLCFYLMWYFSGWPFFSLLPLLVV